jgi:hypothetical protein
MIKGDSEMNEAIKVTWKWPYNPQLNDEKVYRYDGANWVDEDGGQMQAGLVRMAHKVISDKSRKFTFEYPWMIEVIQAV